MKRVIRLAVVDPNDVTRAQLKNLLLGVDTVWLEAECSRYEFFMDVAMQTQPDIALVTLDSNQAAALDTIAKLRQQVPACSVLAVSSSQEGSLILQAMRNGAQEFLGIPLSLEDFMMALERVRHSGQSGSDEDEVRDSKVITVAGVNGGVGSTCVAVNLACVLAHNPKNSVALIDLDLALGDADVWLDIIPDYTIQDVAENISRIDYSLLKRSLTKHDSGLFLLPRPVNLDNTFHLGAEELRRVVALLKATFTHLIIDVSKSYNNMEMAAIGMSNHVMLVTQMDLPCLRNVVRLIQYFDTLESIGDKLQVVLNRFGLSDNQISYNKALDTIGREVFWKIPNDYATMVESRNNGVPLIMQAPKAKLTRSYVEMAEKISEGEVSTEKESSGGKKTVFRFLSRNK
ncbi:AAA family ATPase [Rubinisphaera brasiliensis]|uniref:Response regulator receiver protein n=1 Tax=Rubinisphaera brasiliensis (strain ATCC 49424 / DSM 5305 / JCM 21570 / IAM 15109 / NBRC 103401 / IFAM 1448) TaxID=756272 RepID=F0SRL4_RUBBR|nr:AAA family ATPase [Rubinisphaera brasiliensis]ADY59137.1 response regulator receiver protein [Rubinisphaera brasiliensis DSM 5305]